MCEMCIRDRSYKWLHRFHIVKGGEETVQSIEKQLVYFHECNQDLYKNKPLLIKAVLCTFLQQTSLFLVSYCVYRAFGFTDASPVSMVCAQAFVTMVSSCLLYTSLVPALQKGFV